MANDFAKTSDGTRICPEGARYVKKVMAGPPRIAILACEGGCLKGEVARVAANILAYQLERDSSVRICMGDAVTGDSGFVKLVETAPKTIVVEGCFMHCGTQIMKTRIADFDPEIVESSRFLNFDRDKYFEIFDLPRAEIEQNAQKVAEYVQRTKFQGQNADESELAPSCCCKPFTLKDLAEKNPVLLSCDCQRRVDGAGKELIQTLAACGYGFAEVEDILRVQKDESIDIKDYFACPLAPIGQCL